MWVKAAGVHCSILYNDLCQKSLAKLDESRLHPIESDCSGTKVNPITATSVLNRSRDFNWCNLEVSFKVCVNRCHRTQWNMASIPLKISADWMSGVMTEISDRIR